MSDGHIRTIVFSPRPLVLPTSQPVPAQIFHCQPENSPTCLIPFTKSSLAMLNAFLTPGALLAATILQLLPLPVAAIPTAQLTTRNDFPVPKSSLEPITWQIPTSPSTDAPTINVTGTIQEAILAASTINPSFLSDFAPIREQAIQKFKSGQLGQQEKEAKAQGQVEVDHWDCTTGSPTGYIDVSHSLWAIGLTRRKPSLGQGRCGRVGCEGSTGAAVWWCNNSVSLPFVSLAFRSGTLCMSWSMVYLWYVPD